MEEEIPKKYPTLGKYILLKTLGKGYNSKYEIRFLLLNSSMISY